MGKYMEIRSNMSQEQSRTQGRGRFMKYNATMKYNEESILSAIDCQGGDAHTHTVSHWGSSQFLLIWMPLKALKSKVESNAVRLRCCACDFDLHVYCHLVRLLTHASAANVCKIDIRRHVAGPETLELSREANHKELEALVCPTIMHTESFMSTMIGVASPRAREIKVQPSFLQLLPETLFGNSPQGRGRGVIFS